MKKVYVNPTIVVRNVNLQHHINQISGAKTEGPWNGDEGSYNGIGVSNDTNDELWGHKNTQSEFM